MQTQKSVNHLRLIYDQEKLQSPTHPLTDIASGSVKRIRRTRSPTPTDAFSEPEDFELPAWDEIEQCSTEKRTTADTPNDIGKIAANISRQYYPDSGNMTWPDDYSSKAKTMRKDAGEAFRVEWALYKALTTALVDSLSDLELKIMLFILNRTWAWKKPREGIPNSQFLNGVFLGGKRVQAPVAKSPTHFSNACKKLERERLIKITEAHCINGSVNVYEINVSKVIATAKQQQQAARKLKESKSAQLRSWPDRHLYPTGI